MSNVRWETFVTDGDGVIDYVRVRSFVGVVLALFSGIGLIAAMFGLIKPGDYVVLGTTALILPVTAGKLADMVTSKNGKNGIVTH